MPSAPEFRAFGYLGDADQGETQVLDPSQAAVEVGLVDDVAADEGLAVPALQGHPLELRSEPLAKLAFDRDPVAATNIAAERYLQIPRRRCQSLQPSTTIVVGAPDRGYGFELV